MNHIRWFLRLVVLSSSIFLIHSQVEHPLVFNPATLTVYNFEKVIPEQKQLSCAVACPERNDEEQNFFKYTLNHHTSNTLFMKSIGNIQEFIDDPMPKKCKNKVELTLLVHKCEDGEYWEFGFEVYYNIQLLRDAINNSRWYEITTANRRHFWEPRHRKGSFGKSKRWAAKLGVSMVEQGRLNEMEQNWGFVWISRIKMDYSISTWNLRSMTYPVNRQVADDKDLLKMRCSNYNLDVSFLRHRRRKGNRYFDYYYSNQQTIFKGVKIPGEGCNGECVKKYDLLMPYHYHATDSNSISCSNFTSVAIWNHIPNELWERIKLFLIAIAKVARAPGELEVVTGTIDILALPEVQKNTKLRKLYLDHKHDRIPIPLHVYKLVRYKSHDCDEQTELCSFNVVIVIQNHPDPNATRLCPIDECHRWGWDYVQLSDIQTENGSDRNQFVYCCELTKPIARKMKNIEIGYERVLNLKAFPRYNESDKKIYEDNLQEEIENKYKELEGIISSASPSPSSSSSIAVVEHPREDDTGSDEFEDSEEDEDSGDDEDTANNERPRLEYHGDSANRGQNNPTDVRLIGYDRR